MRYQRIVTRGGAEEFINPQLVERVYNNTDTDGNVYSVVELASGQTTTSREKADLLVEMLDFDRVRKVIP